MLPFDAWLPRRSVENLLRATPRGGRHPRKLADRRSSIRWARPKLVVYLPSLRRVLHIEASKFEAVLSVAPCEGAVWRVDTDWWGNEALR